MGYRHHLWASEVIESMYVYASLLTQVWLQGSISGGKFDGANVGKTLRSFLHEIGAPEHLTYDGHKIQVGRNT